MFSMSTIINGVVITALAAAAIGMYVLANVDDYATQFANDKLVEAFEDSGLRASIGEANFVSGVGLELRDFEIVDLYQTQNGKLCAARSVLIRFPNQIGDLVTTKIVPTAIDIDGLKLFVDQREFDDEFKRRLKSIGDRLPQSDEPAPVRIRNSAILVRSTTLKKEMTFRNLSADINPVNSDEGQVIEFQLQAENDLVPQLELRGKIDFAQKKWNAELNRFFVSLNDEFVNALPLPPQSGQAYLSGLVGKAALKGIASGNFDQKEPQFALRGRAIDVSINNNQIPGNVRNASIDFQVSNRGFKINQLFGNFENSKFDLKYEQIGLARRSFWTTSGSIEQFNFNERVRAIVPQKFEKACKEFSPSGLFDLQFAFDSEGRKKISTQITDMSFSFYKFPYQVDHCVGNFNWVNETVDFDFQGFEQGQLLKLSGRVNNPGKRSTFRSSFGTDGRLPIDEKLIASLQNYPVLEKAVRDFRASGFVSGHGVVEKLTPGSATLKRDIRILLHDASVRHRKFDYPMQEVSGSARVTDDEITFENVVGRSSSGTAVCNGSWNPRAGLQLVFNCESIELDQHLRHSLTPAMQGIWDGFRPQGKIASGRVDLELPPGRPFADIRIFANLGNQSQRGSAGSISIFPTWFPYRIDNLNGSVEIGGGVIRANNIVGNHDRSSVGFSVTGQYSDLDWSVNLNDLSALQVGLDDELLFALPTELSDAIRQLEFEGLLNLSGALTFAGDNEMMDSGSNSIQLVNHQEHSEQVDVGWDVRLDMDQSKMLMGLPLENIFGSVRLRGSSQNDKHECSGEILVDSLTVYGMQITSIQGPIWIDNYQTLAGKFARGGDSEAPSLVGQMFNGKVSFDGRIAHEGRYPFRLQTVIEKAQLDDLALELAPELRELSGDGYAFLKLGGNANEPHTYNGQGNIHLRNAKIHQLPVVLSLLKILSIKEVNRTAFDSSNVDFSVKGNQLKLNRIELIGDAISLIGNGYLELLRHADINFYSVVGRNRFYIPLISELYRAGSQRIMWINIGGPLNNLQTTRKVLPGLDDSLRALIGAGNIENNQANRPAIGGLRR